MNLFLIAVLTLVLLLRERHYRTGMAVMGEVVSGWKEDFHALVDANRELQELHAEAVVAQRLAEDELESVRIRSRLSSWSGKPVAAH